MSAAQKAVRLVLARGRRAGCALVSAFNASVAGGRSGVDISASLVPEGQIAGCSSERPRRRGQSCVGNPASRRRLSQTGCVNPARPSRLGRFAGFHPASAFRLGRNASFHPERVTPAKRSETFGHTLVAISQQNAAFRPQYQKMT